VPETDDSAEITTAEITTGEFGLPRDGLAVASRVSASGVLTVAVRGELDMLGAPVLDDFLADRLPAGAPPTVLVLDLRRVTFLGSAGLSVLVDWQRGKGATRRVTLRLAGVTTNRPVARALQAAGLASLFPLAGGAA
jgi:anti-sigma B factor antagonist